MKTLKIGIASYDRMKARTLAIARGEHKPAGGEPMMWFTSTDSFAKMLSGRNCELLATIAREKPDSITELAELTGRSKSSLSRTLRTMSRYGLVELKEGERGTLIPRVPYDRVSLQGVVSQETGSICERTFSDHERNCTMPDDRKRKIPQDAGRINLTQPHEIAYWCKEFDCMESALREAVDKVGDSADAVRAEIRRKKRQRSVSPSRVSRGGHER